MEGIREYRIVTNSFPAEYGMTMGSQMVILSKSGTNAFHGSLFEYLRNNVFDARNFFDYKTNVSPGRLPPYKRNQFGGSVSGPIRKDKLFFFGVYEALRERLEITTITNTKSRFLLAFCLNVCMSEGTDQRLTQGTHACRQRS